MCADTHLSLSSMKDLLLCKPPPGLTELQEIHVNTSILPQSRMLLVDMARDKNSTHVFWVDSDMTFPQDAAHRMLAHDVPLVASNACQRRPPYTHTAIGLDGKRCFTEHDSKGLTRIRRIGLALALTRIDVFAKVPRPWFHFLWNEPGEPGKTWVGSAPPPPTGYWTGEDYSLCEALFAAGVPIYVDHDLTKEVGHMAEIRLGYEFGLGFRDAKAAQQAKEG